MKILDALRGKPGGEDLANRLLTEVRPRTLAKLKHVGDLFPDFTDHTIRHADGVLAILDWLVPDDVKTALNEWELYFLAVAAYTHDLGMVQGCPGPPCGREWEEFYKGFQAAQSDAGVEDESAVLLEAKRRFVRDHHHIRSEEYIRNEWRELGLRASDTPAEGQIVGRLALGHRKVDLGDRTMFGEIAFGNNQLVRRDLLAAYLRLADDLDTTALRTPWAEYEVLTDLGQASALEWAMHLSVAGVSAEQGIIVVAGECRDHNVFLRLRRLHQDLSAKLVDVKRMLRRPYATGDGFLVADPLPYHDVDLRIEHVGYLPIEIKFELQHKEIAQLIMGERLYGDRTACIRELLQNAVDTCREARERRPAAWTAKIQAAEEDGGKVISVTDNGMGMDEYIVRQYFAKVGFSYYSSPDFEGGFRPISEFGIGILSCFMLAERIEVESKRQGAEPIHLDIGSLTEPFVPRRGSRTEPGTSVGLHLKPEVVGSFELLERVRHFARHVEFPIEVESRDGKHSVVADEGLAPRPQELLAVVRQVGDLRKKGLRAPGQRRITRFHAARERAGTRVGITLLRPLTESGFRLRGAGEICQQGFLVCQVPRLGVSDVWCEVNLSGDGRLALTADRTRPSDDWDPAWVCEIAELCSEAIEELYGKTENEKSPAVWWRYHTWYYDSGIDPVPKALASEARQHAEYCTLTRDGFRTRPLCELEDWPGCLYWTDLGNHGELASVRTRLPVGALVVFKPDWSPVHTEWFVAVARLTDGRTQYDEALLADLGVEFRQVKLAGAERLFVDVGAPVGPWRVSPDWAKATTKLALAWDWDYQPFDARHAFSRLLLERCRGELPRRSRRLLAELFRISARLTAEGVERHQREVFEALKADGVLESDAEFPKALDSSVEPHECPYEGP